MIWWLKLMAVWLSVDILVVATSWYAVNTIKKYFPDWWEREIACEVDANFNLEPQIIEVPSLTVKSKALK
jgi:hypothetical protein